VNSGQRELQDRFHIQAAIVRTSTAGRLEPATRRQSIFDAYPFTGQLGLHQAETAAVMSSSVPDPECVIVDEAHTCTHSGQGKQQRYQLLKGLTENPDRHMILLTATPHRATKMPSLICSDCSNPEFTQLKGHSSGKPLKTSRRLARHFVQRRRPDIEEWQDNKVFPERLTAEITYELSGAWGKLFRDVLDYARDWSCAEGKATRTTHELVGSSWHCALHLSYRLPPSIPCVPDCWECNPNRVQIPIEEIERQAQERVMDGTDDSLSRMT